MRKLWYIFKRWWPLRLFEKTNADAICVAALHHKWSITWRWILWYYWPIGWKWRWLYHNHLNGTTVDLCTPLGRLYFRTQPNMRRYVKESRIIAWLNKHGYDFKVEHKIFDTMFTISTPNLEWYRVKARTHHKVGKLVHNVKNLGYWVLGYKLVDAQYKGDCKVFLGVEDISNTTNKALVPRKWNNNKSGWALRIAVNEDGNMIAENNKPLYYKQWGDMSWM